MASVTRIRIKKCGAYDQLLDVYCNQPKDHDDNHRYSEGPDLQFTWSDAEEKKKSESVNWALDPMLGYANLAGDCW